MSRPDFEELYKICFRQYSSLLNDIGDILDKRREDDACTNADIIQLIEALCAAHSAGLWSK